MTPPQDREPPSADPAQAAHAIECLRLSKGQLEQVRDAFAAQISLGLARDDEQIPALPAFLPPPPPGLKGRAHVVDLGGTNARGAVVEVGPNAPAVIGLSSEPFDDNEMSAEQAFDQQARLLTRLEGEPPLPLGYCCSYPIEVQADGDAILLRWTKEKNISGVIGRRVGKLLVEAAQRRGIATGNVAVLNDTVAALLGGPPSYQARAPRTIGLIVGTGFNMAGFFTPAQAPKLARFSSWSGPMAVNLEAAQFRAPHLTRWDDEVDQRSSQPGKTRFEKAVSGLYLPLLFEAILPRQPGFDPAAGSAALVEVRERGASTAQQIASALFDRSADLVAAGLAAIAKLYGTGEEIQVLAEGGLFWSVPGYPERVQRSLKQLVEAEQQVTLIPKQEHVNLVGSAHAALLRAEPG